jgi:phage I-like protein
MDTSLPRFADAVVLAAAEIDKDGRQWIQVMPTADQAKNGPWLFTITSDDLGVFAQSIRDKPGKIPVDYDHADGSTRAAGWFTGEAKVENDTLLAQVQWTPKALQEIADGEFRFISPEFDFEEKDKKTGLLTRAKEIIAATLTNRPFFKDLAPVAKDLLESDEVDAIADTYGTEVAELILAALGGDTEKVRAAAAQRLLSNAGDTPSADEKENEEMDYQEMFKALGLDADADPQKKVAALLTKQAEDNLALQAEVTELKAKDGEVAKLTEQIEELRVKDVRRDLEVVLAKAVDDGQIFPSEKDDYAAVGEKIGVTELRSLIAKRPKGFAHSKGKEIGSGGTNRPTFDDPDTTAVAKKMGIVGDDPVDDQSARVHARAEEILKERGKTTPTYEDWAEVYEEVQRVGV